MNKMGLIEHDDVRPFVRLRQRRPQAGEIIGLAARGAEPLCQRGEVR